MIGCPGETRVFTFAGVLSLLIVTAACDTLAPDNETFHYTHVTGGGIGCAISLEASTYCWGGTGTANAQGTYRTRPTVLANDQAFQTVESGGGHACGITDGGALYCWGGNGEGQVGDGTRDYSDSAIRIDMPGRVEQVNLGAWHSCALVEGDAYCWGANSYGQLGAGTNEPFSTLPLEVPLDAAFVDLGLGTSKTCGVTETGAAYCWGSRDGDFILPDTIEAWSTPVLVADSPRLRKIAVGTGFVCALTTDGVPYCWGQNWRGFLGTGDFEARSTPTRVADAQLRLRTISAGIWHVCGVDFQDHAVCWGSGSAGQLGHGSFAPRNTPMIVPGDLRFRIVDAGYYNTCGISKNFVAYCWGMDVHGELGNGPLEASNRPVPIAPPRGE